MLCANAGPNLEVCGPGPSKYRNDAVRDEVGRVTGWGVARTGLATKLPQSQQPPWNAVAESVTPAPLSPAEADG
jgi:hypothetical protein